VYKQTITFDDVLLEPQYSDIISRSQVDIHGTIDDRSKALFLPIISSPMDTVTEVEMAINMHRLGGLGIIHRYNTIDEQCDLVKETLGQVATVGAAIGVTSDYLERAAALYDAGVRVLCVDVAHGHHIMMKNALTELRGILGDDLHIMAGNVGTLEGFNALADWGADSIRVGIGGGSICSTRIQTGHGIPTLQSVLECGRSDRDARLIADGGIKTSGDIVKAIAAGADFVILGSLLGGCEEAPGDTFRDRDGRCFKTYRGMASAAAQRDWRGSTASLEGVSTTVPCKGPVKKVVEDLVTGIRSGFSYSGARTKEELQAKAKFIIQSQASSIESTTHILHR